MSKGNSQQQAARDTAAADSNSNDWYTAHQVHTLAQLTYQRLAGSWQARAPWPAPGSAAPPAPGTPAGNSGWAWSGPAWTSQAPQQPGSPFVIYWYA
jgi:hypothetical protein